MSSTKRTQEEQEQAEKIHKAKCCTTKWMGLAINLFFIGIILLVSAVGLYGANELDEYTDAQFQEDCYIVESQEQGSRCNTESCANCFQPTYFLGTVYQPTCGKSYVGKSGPDSCEQWDNGCISISATGSCRDVDSEGGMYDDGESVACYVYDDVDSCNDAGRIDPDDEWGGQFTSYVVLLVFAIILIILGVIFFVIGFFRCLCKKIEDPNDQVMGEQKGTGCYACLDYDRMCWGESAGHATVVQEVDTKNAPQKKKKRKKQSMDAKDGGSGKTTSKKGYNSPNKEDDDEEYYDEENQHEIR